MSEIIVRPLVANVMNCVMCTLMSFGLLITPQKFMQGGQYQKPWFQNLPENREKLYYLGPIYGICNAWRLCKILHF